MHRLPTVNFQPGKTENLDLAVESRPSKLMAKGDKSGYTRDLSRTTFVENVESEAIWRAQAAALEAKNQKKVWRCFSARSFRGRAKELATSPLLGNAILALILINLVFLGIEVDMGTTRGQNDIPRWFNVLNFVIVCIFCAEILLKLVGLGLSDFCCGPERWWNMFDVGIIITSLVEALIEMFAHGSLATQMVHIRSLRFIRVIRALRGFRVIRLLRYVSALRGLIFSIVSTMGSLMWTMVLLASASDSWRCWVLLYCIATTGCTDHGIVNTFRFRRISPNHGKCSESFLQVGITSRLAFWAATCLRLPMVWRV